MYFPKIDEKKCTLCRECADVCPADVFAVDGKEVVVANPADCLGCESCVAVCPVEAITVNEI